ncbi:hypothetical protein CDAR_389961 [Caerostris darwini]|uniref:Uncharacterized protein n=1 Tax=Caerostris darwini TaxID=1538125 RepID=A0AAV4QRZ6_9ARAC|nr:hypothetical protein CDAR_389961 [Caerostris darwini]
MESGVKDPSLVLGSLTPLAPLESLTPLLHFIDQYIIQSDQLLTVDNNSVPANSLDLFERPSNYGTLSRTS